VARLKVTATWHGGYAATVTARGHAIDGRRAVDGGGDDGRDATEVFWRSLASCFALALGMRRAATARSCRAAGRGTAERAGASCATGAIVLTRHADVPRPAGAARGARGCAGCRTRFAATRIENRSTEDP
jgi:hypothetical protein